MDDVQTVFRDLKERADELGVYFKAPLTPLQLREWSLNVRSSVNFDVPEGYLALLSLSDGLETQRGLLYDAASFLDQNYVSWCCETRGLSTAEGFVVEYVPLAVPREPEYACLGSYGNMDEYVFDFATREYRATQFGSVGEVFFSAPTLAGLLRYMVRTEL